MKTMPREAFLDANGSMVEHKSNLNNYVSGPGRRQATPR